MRLGKVRNFDEDVLFFFFLFFYSGISVWNAKCNIEILVILICARQKTKLCRHEKPIYFFEKLHFMPIVGVCVNVQSRLSASASKWFSGNVEWVRAHSCVGALLYLQMVGFRDYFSSIPFIKHQMNLVSNV